jgi:hypothetical protein
VSPTSFASEGWTAVAVGTVFFLIAGGTMLWLRGPGNRPHDPPVARDRVRQFAGLVALFGALWIVRAVAGLGGFVVVSGVLLIASLALVARTRIRRS